MGELTLTDIFGILKDAGLLGALLFALIGGYRRVWVWGYQLDECKERENAWKAMALRTGEVADKNAEAALEIVKPRRK